MIWHFTSSSKLVYKLPNPLVPKITVGICIPDLSNFVCGMPIQLFSEYSNYSPGSVQVRRRCWRRSRLVVWETDHGKTECSIRFSDYTISRAPPVCQRGSTLTGAALRSSAHGHAHPKYSPALRDRVLPVLPWHGY